MSAADVDEPCRQCGEPAGKIYRCQHCGAPDPLDGDGSDDEESSGRHVMADGGHTLREVDQDDVVDDESVDVDRGRGVVTDGGLDEDELDDTDEFGVPDGEGRDLGDMYAGGSDATNARRALLDAVDEHATDEEAAPVGVVVDTALDRSDAPLRIVLRQCKLLLEQGDIYPPTNGTLRRTLTDGGVFPPDVQVGGAGLTFRGPGGFSGGDQA